jgi:hypothetical protein
MQRIADVNQQTLEHTTQSRESIKALNRSCEPWQRLAVLDPAAEAVNTGVSAARLQASDGSPSPGARILTSTSSQRGRAISTQASSLDGSRKAQRSAICDRVGSDRSR